MNSVKSTFVYFLHLFSFYKNIIPQIERLKFGESNIDREFEQLRTTMLRILQLAPVLMQTGHEDGGMIYVQKSRPTLTCNICSTMVPLCVFVHKR